MLTSWLLTIFSIYCVCLFVSCAGHHEHSFPCEFCQKPCDITCSKQILSQNISDEDCIVRKGPDENCRNMDFQIHGGNNLGRIELSPWVEYVKGVPYRSAINVTFLEVKWDRLKFQSKDRSDHPRIFFCREFILSRNVNLLRNETLFFDCPWVKSGNENGEFEFKYEAYNSETGQTEAGYFVYTLPINANIDPNLTKLDNWRVFSYLDISELPILALRWTQPPTKFVVKQYEIQVINNESSTVVDTRIVNSNEKVAYFDVGLLPKTIYITIKINNFMESISKTPVLRLAGNSSYIALYIFVPLLLFGAIFLFFFFGWKRSQFLGQKPSILILYKYTRRSHFNAISSFVKCLKEVAHAKVLLDILDIPLSETKDPLQWYHEAFRCAEYILVIASPSVHASCEGSIYPNADGIGLHLLAADFCNKNRYKRIFTVIFPYCKKEDIPPEAVSFPSFKLMKDFNDVIWHIRHNTRCWVYTKLIPSVLSVCGKTIGAKDHCKTMLQAFDEAKEDLKNCSVEVQSNKKEIKLESLEVVSPLSVVDNYSYKSSPCELLPEDVCVVFPEDINSLLGSEGEETDSEMLPKSISNFDIQDLLSDE